MYEKLYFSIRRPSSTARVLAIPATQASVQQQTVTAIVADGKQSTLPFAADVQITSTELAQHQNGIPHAVKEETIENGTSDNSVAT